MWIVGDFRSRYSWLKKYVVRKINYNFNKILRGYLWSSFNFGTQKLVELSLVAKNQFHFFINFAHFYETFILKKFLGWMLPHKTFIYLFLTPLLFLMTSMTFCVVRGLYRRCKHVVYDICGPPIGILFICWFICLFIYLFLKSGTKAVIILTPAMEFRS